MHFFTSTLPGCGKSQEAMRQVASLVPRLGYYRIPIRLGTVEDLLAMLKKVDSLSSGSRKQGAFLNIDGEFFSQFIISTTILNNLFTFTVAHSISFEFNHLLLFILIHGALYDPSHPKKAKLRFWSLSHRTTIAIEFSSPFGSKEFPVIGYLDQHSISECTGRQFTRDLAVMPRFLGQEIVLSRSNALVASGKFLKACFFLKLLLSSNIF